MADENILDPKPKSDKTSPPPPLTRNLTSMLGWGVTGITAAVLLVLILADIVLGYENPYNSMVTYLILPGVLGGGVALILLGVLLEWRRRHKIKPGEYPTLPTVNLNLHWQRRRLFLGTVGLTLFFAFSAVGTYHAYHFTESPTFCGEICHHVMEPEYTAYQFSPHARVACTECHIGSGADWYVKSKMSGLRQVWAVATNSYELPIETPVHNLRPARDTCEHCHWPGKFTGGIEKEIWHFSPDQTNTAMRYNLLMKVGGGEPEVGLGHGIHWHMASNVTVRYWARDEDRLDIPWVEVEVGGGEPKVFKSEDCPDSLPEDAEIRTMDCMDCHNRPSHVYRSPRTLIDTAMVAGLLDPSLPFLKRYATALYDEDYETTEEALANIETTLKKRYEERMKGNIGGEQVNRAIDTLQTLYTRNFFPEQGVDWTVYPNHRGHFEWPGCYRCHDDKHEAADGKKISYDCNLCHQIVDQAEGLAAYQPPEFQKMPFQHPRGLGDIWMDRNCTDCHGVQHESVPEESH